jgi:hypothetical protein
MDFDDMLTTALRDRQHFTLTAADCAVLSIGPISVLAVADAP